LSPNVDFQQAERATAEIFGEPGLYSLLSPNALPEPEVDVPRPPPHIHQLEVEVPCPILPDVEEQPPVIPTEGWTPGALAALSHEERARFDPEMLKAAETLEAIQVSGETPKQQALQAAAQPATSMQTRPPCSKAPKTPAGRRVSKAATTRAGSKRGCANEEAAQSGVATEPLADAMVTDTPVTSTSVSVVSSRGSTRSPTSPPAKKHESGPPAKKQKQSAPPTILNCQKPPFDIPVSDALKDQPSLPGLPPREMFSIGLAWSMLTCPNPKVATGVFFADSPTPDIAKKAGFEQLTHDEIILCAWMHMPPVQYLDVRQRLFLAFHACTFKPDGTLVDPLQWNKSRAQKVKGMDVNKISFLHAYYEKLGLWEHRWD
jgi:hypothetical protein